MRISTVAELYYIHHQVTSEFEQ